MNEFVFPESKKQHTQLSFILHLTFNKLGVKIELVANSILAHLAQGVTEFAPKVALGVKLLSGSFLFLRNSFCVT
jgi:hypothetical protein